MSAVRAFYRVSRLCYEHDVRLPELLARLFVTLGLIMVYNVTKSGNGYPMGPVHSNFGQSAGDQVYLVP